MLQILHKWLQFEVKGWTFFTVQNNFILKDIQQEVIGFKMRPEIKHVTCERLLLMNYEHFIELSWAIWLHYDETWSCGSRGRCAPTENRTLGFFFLFLKKKSTGSFHTVTSSNLPACCWRKARRGGTPVFSISWQPIDGRHRWLILVSSDKCSSWVTLRCSVSRLSESLRAAAAVGDVKFFLHWEQMLLFDPVEPVDSGCCPSLRAVMENRTQPFYSQTCWMWPRASSESLRRPVFTSLTRSGVFYSLLFKGPNVWFGCQRSDVVKMRHVLSRGEQTKWIFMKLDSEMWFKADLKPATESVWTSSGNVYSPASPQEINWFLKKWFQGVFSTKTRLLFCFLKSIPGTNPGLFTVQSCFF